MAATSTRSYQEHTKNSDTLQTFSVRVRGTVQGVGFRPMVWRLAHRIGLLGEVLNDSEGVLINISGTLNKLNRFLQHLKDEQPPLALIETIEVKTIKKFTPFKEFRIAESKSSKNLTGVTPDAAVCDDCKEEIQAPNERRNAYPFTNCTHCGPRLTIVNRIPYDRTNTSMADFPMCEACAAEYHDPNNRRFHAQPIACPACGPKIWLEDSKGKLTGDNDTAIKIINAYLDQGKIVAIRGLGGYHLACDARNETAVNELRRRKHRYAKPFALMAHEISIIERYCHISKQEQEQLQSPEAPIVLLTSNHHKPLAAGIVPHTAAKASLYGFMLPYTPLHFLITQNIEYPLVMTSGNFSDEPQIIDNQTAKQTLFNIADIVLFHDREIINRIDDSVLRCFAGKPRLIRRARAYAPKAIPLPRGFEQAPELLAFGGELKSTFCLLKDKAAIVSQHQGDLENAATFDDYQKNLSLYKNLYDHIPRLLAADLHPEYLSNKLAKQAAVDQNLELIEVQHHHAHIASCLAENAYPLDAAPVLGIAIDGLGFGDDHTFWGGEFMLADYNQYQRLGTFKPTSMIGGAQAIYQPWRSTYAYIDSCFAWQSFQKHFSNLELCRYLSNKPVNTISKMLKNNINVPLASSCGRLFDAVAAAIDICRDRADFEGQGAIELETLVDDKLLHSNKKDSFYPFAINVSQNDIAQIDSKPMWVALLNDLNNGISTNTIATRFHKGLAIAIETMIRHIKTTYARKNICFDAVALSGGCFQNKVLLETVIVLVEQNGLRCLTQSMLPSNDGGLSLGQALIAAAQTLRNPHTRRTQCA